MMGRYDRERRYDINIYVPTTTKMRAVEKRNPVYRLIPMMKGNERRKKRRRVRESGGRAIPYI